MHLCCKLSKDEEYLNNRVCMKRDNDDSNCFNIIVHDKSNENVLADIRCYFAGSERTILKARHLDDAISELNTYLSNTHTLSYVVIEGISFDKNNIKGYKHLLKSLFSLVLKVVDAEFDSRPSIAIYWYLNDEDISIVKEVKEWDCSHKLLNDRLQKALILYL